MPKTARRGKKMKTKITGDTLPVLEIGLEAGDTQGGVAGSVLGSFFGNNR